MTDRSKGRDCFADEAASPTVKWFTCADFDLPCDSDADAMATDGWYWKDPSKVMFWHGPFATSKEAADAESKAITILGTAHRIAPSEGF